MRIYTYICMLEHNKSLVLKMRAERTFLLMKKGGILIELVLSKYWLPFDANQNITRTSGKTNYACAFQPDVFYALN